MHNLTPAPQGLPIDLALAIDDDGILTVHAKEEAKSEWKSCTVELDDRTASDIVAQVEDAERFKEEDELEVKRLEASFELDMFLSNMSKKVTKKSLNLNFS